MKKIRFFIFAALALGALLGAEGEAKAQFSRSGIGQEIVTKVAIPLNPGEIDTRVVNESEARLMRLRQWHARNSIDCRASLTGMVTQFSKSWTTNNQNSVSSELAAYFHMVHSRDKYTATVRFDGIYGMNFIDDVWFKNQDKLEFYHLSSWKMGGIERLKNWAYGFSAKFLSQFAQGFKGRAEGDRDVVWSNFMAPGLVNAGVGFTFTSPKPKLPFIVTVNPISVDALFVLDNNIDDERRHKLGIALPGEALAGQFLYTDYRQKIEGGSSVNVDFNRTFVLGGQKNLTLQYTSTLNSFYGWMAQVSRKEPVEGAPELPAIMPTFAWTNRFIFTPLRFLMLEFRTSTLYDKSQVDKVQMQYYLRVGLTFGYKNR